MLASEPHQLAYERSVPHVDITQELIAGWFDDSYHPNEAQFRACFENDELQALATFDAIYKAQRVLLPSSNGSVKAWLASAVWREVMSAAATTLADVKPHPKFQRTAAPPLS